MTDEPRRRGWHNVWGIRLNEVVFRKVPTNHTRGIYPGYYPTKNLCKFSRTCIPQPGLLEVLCEIHTCTRNVWKFCTPAPQIPGVRVYHYYNACEFCTPVPQYPELFWVLYHFCSVPGTSVSSVRSPYDPNPNFLLLLFC